MAPNSPHPNESNTLPVRPEAAYSPDNDTHQSSHSNMPTLHEYALYPNAIP